MSIENIHERGDEYDENQTGKCHFDGDADHQRSVNRSNIVFGVEERYRHEASNGYHVQENR